MQFDISRDFLDGMMLQHPAQASERSEIKAGGGLQFLPSSPDGTMHTAVVTFRLLMDDAEQPFARAGWRFLFTTEERYDPQADRGNPFQRQLLITGASKIIAVLNNCCMHANMPLIPIDGRQLAKQASAQAQEQPAGDEQKA